MPAPEVTDALARVVRALPGGGEARPGQVEMAGAVADAIAAGRHVVVRAGTGTGKTLGYLVPAVLSGKRVVVATATRALQDQLAAKDLPFLDRHLGRSFSWAVLKGRSNYVCVQRLAEVAPSGVDDAAGFGALPDDGGRDRHSDGDHDRGDRGDHDRGDSDHAERTGAGGEGGGAGTPVAAPTRAAGRSAAGGQLALDGLAERADAGELATIAAWAAVTTTGDRAELDTEPGDATWAAVSTTSRDCPGAHRCPRGDRCFAEAARARAAEADVVVVNLHLYGLDLAAGGAILPDHDVTVIDEAHVLDDIISATTGVEIGPGRFSHLGRVLRGILAEAGDTITGVADSAGVLTGALAGHRDQRLTAPLPDALAGALAAVRRRVEVAQSALRNLPDQAGDDVSARAVRARQAATALLDDLDAVTSPSDDQVLFVAGPEHAPALRLAPLDVADLLRERLWSHRAAVLTSATLAPGFGPQVGLPQRADELLDVGSPFDYPANGLIYCAARLPRPNDPRWPDAAIAELAALIEAAGGRTLALFTSYKAMHRAVEALRDRLPFPLLAQGDQPKQALVERFAGEPETCLFATMSFWQGIDVPGPSLSLVTIDRLPFPRPDDPLLEARREHAGPGAFTTIDVPRAATLLAQGVGRLIRTSTDRGAVAVLDPRLATARYGPKIVATLPRMRRTRDRTEIEAFLRDLRRRPMAS
ncbi:MAG TPA: ATP-dependent DNA helicase [Acidimicrobiales bacterium]|nr:ATP-dependent DNA helicase [Acidimicrobiales bacterium]